LNVKVKIAAINQKISETPLLKKCPDFEVFRVKFSEIYKTLGPRD